MLPSIEVFVGGRESLRGRELLHPERKEGELTACGRKGRRPLSLAFKVLSVGSRRAPFFRGQRGRAAPFELFW